MINDVTEKTWVDDFEKSDYISTTIRVKANIGKKKNDLNKKVSMVEIYVP